MRVATPGVPPGRPTFLGVAMANAPMRPVESIDRALSLLTVLMDAGGEGLALGELASRVGVAKATCFRAASTLRLRGFLEQDVDTGRYRLGPMALRMGEAFATTRYLAGSLHPALVRLSRRTGELVHLGVLSGDRMLYVDKVEPERSIRVWSAVGQLVPVATSALGRAVLATRDLTDQQLASYLLGTTDREIPLERLRDAVASARRLGYAEEHGENEPDIACVAVALMRDDTAVAAVSITTLATRLTPRRRTELAEILRSELPGTLPSWLSLMPPRP